MNRVVVTGATGFVGSALIDRLLKEDLRELRVAVRSTNKDFSKEINVVVAGALSDLASWARVFDHMDIVVHCAARVHIMDEVATDPLAEFRLANVYGTLNIAKQAAAAGVRRFIFISSIKVNGECTSSRCPYLADDKPSPKDPYGISKMEAEEGLKLIAAETGMEVVIIRPVLVYGPGVQANFNNMMKWIHKGVPLPFARINNKRSLIALDNLVDLIFTCIDHPSAANQVFLASDDHDLSTPELLKLTGSALGKSALLFTVPNLLFQTLDLLGKTSLRERLCGSLQVDIAKTKGLLGWTPPITVDDALYRTAQYFLENLKR